MAKRHPAQRRALRLLRAIDLRARSSYQEPQPTPRQAQVLAALQRDAAG